MSLKVAYILGAGLGTRMGPVGETLPKLLWPVFEKSLLELQIDYALECGIEKIYLNTHFQAELIEKIIRAKKINIEILHEGKLLDIGGAVHNLAKKLNYKGKVLLLNGDQFLMLPENEFEEFTKKSEGYVASLLGLKVPECSQYNELIVKQDILCSIEKPSSIESYYTYSGVSIINFDILKPREGVSKFFESVANFKENATLVYRPNEFEYWDFGTTERYFKSMKQVLSDKSSKFKSFLIRNHAFVERKVTEKYCYNTSGREFSINLNDKALENGYGNIVISGKDIDSENESIVIYNDKVSRF